jgi:CBS domain-containing protein
MKHQNVGFVPVIDATGRLVGVVTDRDLAVRVLSEGRSATTELWRIMTKEVVTFAADDDLREAEAGMIARQVSRVVITGPHGRCLGVLSISDIVRVEESRRSGQVMRGIAARESAPPPSMR